MLLFHILSAITSIICTGYAYMAPSRRKVAASYALTACTLASGTALVIATRAPLPQSCAAGLTYLAIVLGGIYAANVRLQQRSR